MSNLRLITLLLLIIETSTHSQQLLPIQGYLTQQNGLPVPEGIKLVRFQIYDEPIGGSPIWGGEIHRLGVNRGLFNVILGTVKPFEPVDNTQSIRPFFSEKRYLEITLDANDDNTFGNDDPPLLPRQQILPAPYATTSGSAVTLSGLGIDRFVTRTPSGNVGIGTDDPKYPLHVGGTIMGAGVQSDGPVPGALSFGGGLIEGHFGNWMQSGFGGADFYRLMGVTGEYAGGYGMARGQNVASPIIWFYAFEDRNCFQVRAVDYNPATGRSKEIPDGTPLMTVRRFAGKPRVGIGMENPNTTLDIDGGFALRGTANIVGGMSPLGKGFGVLRVQSEGDVTSGYIFQLQGSWPIAYQADRSFIVCQDLDGMRWRVRGDGATFTSSTRTLKSGIKTYSNALERLISLRGVRFRWNTQSTSDQESLGFIAEEVGEILPEAVDEQHKAVNYSAIIPVLVEGFKELNIDLQSMKRTSTLQSDITTSLPSNIHSSRLADIEARLERLERLVNSQLKPTIEVSKDRSKSLLQDYVRP